MRNSSYNLSSVPGFNELVKTDSADSTNTTILKLNKTECRSNNSLYKVIRYDKNFLNYDLVLSYGLCRSVIINSADQVVGFAPPKSISAESFIEKYPVQSLKGSIVAEEFLEGTMINVFFDSTIGITGAWEISTRNTVGATSSFYKSHNVSEDQNKNYPPGRKNKTFREMFMEAAKVCGLDINQLDKELSYSFVLQHPENRIVVPFKKPQLSLVSAYKIHNQNGVISVEYLHSSSPQCKHIAATTKVRLPEKYTFEKYSDLINRYASMNTSYDIMGVVLYNTENGVRAKIRNPVYEQVRSLKGNQPKLYYQYLCLRGSGKVKDFLKYYPENKADFSAYRDQVHIFTDTLYENYVACYIKKSKPLLEFPKQFRTHMYTIHQHYLNELREKKQFITNTYVQKYVNGLHPSLLMYCLNFHMRQRNVDTIVNSN
jgi:hypothetical protein